jgi:hypothetical protein
MYINTYLCIHILIYVGPHENCTPTSIRNTLQRGPPVFDRLNNDTLPLGFWNFFTKISKVTSWVFPIFNELKLDGCQQMLHTPVFNLKLTPFDVSVVYRPHANQIAVICICRRANVDKLERMMPTGGVITNAEEASTKYVK